MNEQQENKNLMGIKNKLIWKYLFELGYSAYDANYDKNFICPLTCEKCKEATFLYFEKTDKFLEDLERIKEILSKC